MRPTDLRGILQYVPQFREKTFVVAVDGAAVADENFANILLDVAVLRSLNIRVVIVHGASAQIRALASEQGVTASNLDGTGITDETTLKLALTAANRLSHEILEGLEIGLGLAVNNLWISLFAAPALLAVHVIAVLPEERYLSEKFGESYRAYAARVRRYL